MKVLPVPGLMIIAASSELIARRIRGPELMFFSAKGRNFQILTVFRYPMFLLPGFYFQLVLSHFVRSFRFDRSPSPSFKSFISLFLLLERFR